MLEPFTITIPPGVVTETTRYSRRGRWIDSNLIRFRGGKVEGMGGWGLAISSVLDGIGRNILGFSSLTGTKSLFMGTTRRAYVWYNSTDLNDITPIVYSVTKANPIYTTISSNRVGVLLDATAPKAIGTVIIISGSTDVGGILAAQINTEHHVVDIIGDTFYFDVGSNATSTVAGGGGGAVTIQELYPAGNADTVVVSSGGWGEPPWGYLGWGGTTDGTALLLPLRFWSGDTWGEDLLISPSDGPIYYWVENTPTVRAVPISGMVGASQVPVAARQIMVSDQNRIAIAFGVNPIGSTDQDPMLIRWSDNENYLEWSPVATDSAAGELRLITGSVFVGAIEAPNEILIWTDTALHAMAPDGTNNVFSLRVVTPVANIFGPKAAVIAGDAIFWGGLIGMYRYAGSVQKIECPVENFILDNIDRSRMAKTVAAATSSKNEVMWMFVSKDSPDGEPDAYIKFNFVENVWDKGYMGRTAWLDVGLFPYPLALNSSSNLLFHEYGVDDLTNPLSPVALNRYIEHGPVEIDGKGYHYIATRFLRPDVDFFNVAVSSVTLNASPIFDYGPGTARTTPNVLEITCAAPDGNPQLYDMQVRMRGRGRTLAMRYASSLAGFNWKIGDMQVIGRPDGRK